MKRWVSILLGILIILNAEMNCAVVSAGETTETEKVYMPLLVCNDLFPGEGEAIYDKNGDSYFNKIYRLVLRSGNEYYMSIETLEELSGYKTKLKDDTMFFMRGVKWVKVFLEKEFLTASVISNPAGQAVAKNVSWKYKDGTYYFSMSDILPWLNMTCSYNKENESLVMVADPVSIWDNEVQNINLFNYVFNFADEYAKIDSNNVKLKAVQALNMLFNSTETVFDTAIETASSTIVWENLYDAMDYYEIFRELMDDDDPFYVDLENAEDTAGWLYKMYCLAIMYDGIENERDTSQLKNITDSISVISSLYEDVVAPTIAFAATYKNIDVQHVNILERMYLNGISWDATSAMYNGVAQVYGQYRDWDTLEDVGMTKGVVSTIIHGTVDLGSDLLLDKAIEGIEGFSESFKFVCDARDEILSGVPVMSWYIDTSVYDESELRGILDKICLYEHLQEKMLLGYYSCYNSMSKQDIENARSFAQMFFWLGKQSYRAMAWYTKWTEQDTLAEEFIAKAEECDACYSLFGRTTESGDNDSSDSLDIRLIYTENYKGGNQYKEEYSSLIKDCLYQVSESTILETGYRDSINDKFIENFNQQEFLDFVIGLDCHTSTIFVDSQSLDMYQIHALAVYLMECEGEWDKYYAADKQLYILPLEHFKTLVGRYLKTFKWDESWYKENFTSPGIDYYNQKENVLEQCYTTEYGGVYAEGKILEIKKVNDNVEVIVEFSLDDIVYKRTYVLDVYEDGSGYYFEQITNSSL